MTVAHLRPSPFAASILQDSACYGTALPVDDQIVRIVANNPKDYTGPGTNTYLLGRQSLWIIDPGPDDERHINAIVDTVGLRQVRGIIVTHSHKDHSPAAVSLKSRLDTEIYGMEPLDPELIDATAEDIDPDYRPDHLLRDGDVLSGADIELTTVHTPGHFPNHLCLYMSEGNILFTGDHVLGWSTTVIVPPLGNLSDYLSSLDKLSKFDASVMLPSHGDKIETPDKRLRELFDHRRFRHEQIVQCLMNGVEEPKEIVEEIYVDLTPRLITAACGQVKAHIDLYKEYGASFFQQMAY